MGIKLNRPGMDPTCICDMIKQVEVKLFSILNKKGYGAFSSKHEIQGVIDEEVFELIQAFHSKNKDNIIAELKDLAVACILGLTCIESELTEW